MAARDWDAANGSSRDDKKVKFILRTYAVAVNIQYSTFQHCDCDDKTKTKCKKLCLLMGRQSLLNHRNQDFVRNVLARQDRSSEGSNVQDAIDLVQELDPKISQQQDHLTSLALFSRATVVLSNPKQWWHNIPPQNAAT
jgi:hypothetical protein